MTEHYVQCRFEQACPEGLRTTVGWIPDRGARPGALVELKGEDGLWRVVSAGGHPVPLERLRAKQASDRAALPSVHA